MQNAYTSFLDAQRQAWTDAAENVERLGSLPDANETMASVDVGQTPHDVVYEENKLQLYHYEPLTEEQHDVPILIVYALINKPYILDLQPDRSVVRTLLENGFDVYLVDWGEPSLMDHSLTLEDYVVRYVDNCVDVVRERSGQDAINLLGYCMGGTMSTMYAGLFPEKVRNLGLMAAGLCFEGEGGILELWGDEEYFEPGAITDTYGNVPAEFLDTGFALMDPVENYVTKYLRFYENVEDEDFVENFARMEQWLSEGIDVAGATFDQFIEEVYQENQLYRGELEVGGREVDLDAIDMPILQIVAEYDHLVPPEASTPFNEVVGSDDTTTIEFRTGHIGMSVSSRSHAELWPDVCDWFEARSNGDGEADVEGAPEAEAATEAAKADARAESGGTSPEETAERTAEHDEADVGRDQAEAAADETDADAEMAGDDVEADDAATQPDTEATLEDIEGVGPAYADRLEDAGITSVADLAGADAAGLAADTEVAPNRILSWIEQAESLLE